LKNRIIAIASEILGENVTEATSMDNFLKWDSLKTLQIIMALDNECISVPLEKIAKIKSIKDLIEFSEHGN